MADVMAEFNYERHELAKLAESETYGLKITSSGADTRWMRINQAQLAAISEILIVGPPDIGAIIERAREEAIRDYIGPGS